MYGTDPRYNEPPYNEILVITSTIQQLKRKMYLDTVTNKCQHETDKINAKQTKDEAS